MEKKRTRYKLPPAAEAAMAIERLRRSKRRLLAILLTAVALLAGCSGSGSGSQRRALGVVELPAAKRHVYFAYADPKYDDNGPGHYQYPTSFNNREGYLDITHFTVEDGGHNVVFRIGCRRPIPYRRDDGSTEAKGWWLQLLDIYIDKDRQAGRGQERALPGRHVTFTPESAWEKVVLVTPNHSRTVEKMLEERTSDMDLVHMRKNIIVPHRAYAQGYEFVVHVPKFEIGTPAPGWGYQVLAMGYNENNLSYGQFQNEEIIKFADDVHYGGGSDYRGDPNVVDMLAPSVAEQHRLLGNHVSAPYTGDDRWAMISCVYGDLPAPRAAASAAKVVSPGVTVAPETKHYLKEAGFESAPPAAPVVPHEALAAPSSSRPTKESNRGLPPRQVHSFEGGF